MRLLFALVFLLGATLPSLLAMAAPIGTAVVEDCHIAKRFNFGIADAHDHRAQESHQDTDHQGEDRFLPCVCVLCLTPAPPSKFGDASPIIIPPRREAWTIRFATGVSATSGPRKAAHFPTGPPLPV